jgi:hypothetical protein
VIPPLTRPTVCGTEARHVLAWAPDGTNAATCVPHAGQEARHLGACRDRVWSWYPPVDAHGTGRLAHRGVPLPRAGQAPVLPLWEGYLAERAKRAAKQQRTAQVAGG